MEGIRASLNRIANSFRRPKLDNLFFMHIPKCGGTSLRRAMSEPYRRLSRSSDAGVVHLTAGPMHEAAELLETSYPALNTTRLEEYLLLYFMAQRRVRFIDGHVPFPAVAHHQHHERFRFITLLRDPVSRWISEYTYNRFHAGEHMAHTAAMDIDDYLASDFGQGQGRQYVLFLGGRREDGDYGCQAAIDNALANVEKFDLVGCLEDIETFSDSFQRQFGQRLRIEARNVSPSPPGYVDQEFTPEVRARIKALCAPDYVLYDHVAAGSVCW